jgi:hypothetical protein
MAMRVAEVESMSAVSWTRAGAVSSSRPTVIKASAARSAPASLPGGMRVEPTTFLAASEGGGVGTAVSWRVLASGVAAARVDRCAHGHGEAS